MSQLDDLPKLPRAEIESLVGRLYGELVDLKRVVVELREEISRLKGRKGRPDIKPNKPSGMDDGTEPKPPRDPSFAVAARSRPVSASRTAW